MVFVALSPDGKHVATASEDQTARIWDISSGKQISAMSSSPPQELSALDFSPDGEFIATSSRDTTAVIWTVHGRQVTTLEGHSGIITSIVFSPDGHLIATGSSDGTASVWSAATGIRLWSSDRRVAPVWSVEFDSGANQLLLTQEKSVFAVPTTRNNLDTVRVRSFVACRSGYQIQDGRLLRSANDAHCGVRE